MKTFTQVITFLVVVACASCKTETPSAVSSLEVKIDDSLQTITSQSTLMYDEHIAVFRVEFSDGSILIIRSTLEKDSIGRLQSRFFFGDWKNKVSYYKDGETFSTNHLSLQEPPFGGSIEVQSLNKSEFHNGSVEAKLLALNSSGSINIEVNFEALLFEPRVINPNRETEFELHNRWFNIVWEADAHTWSEHKGVVYLEGTKFIPASNRTSRKILSFPEHLDTGSYKISEFGDVQLRNVFGTGTSPGVDGELRIIERNWGSGFFKAEINCAILTNLDTQFYDNGYISVYR